VLDLYIPLQGLDPATIATAEQELRNYLKAEHELKGYVDAAWEPMGVEIARTARQLYSQEELPIIMHTQEGLFLLRDELLEELQGLGVGWLLKGRFSAETDRMTIEGLILRSGHRLGTGKPRVLIIDDNPKYIEAFIERQSEEYEITSIQSEDEVLRTLTRLEAEGNFPDVFVVDMYYPRGDDEPSLARIDAANQKLREFAEVEQRLKVTIRASYEPSGLDALKRIRNYSPAAKLPVVVYAQSGMLLLKDRAMQGKGRLGSPGPIHNPP